MSFTNPPIWEDVRQNFWWSPINASLLDSPSLGGPESTVTQIALLIVASNTYALFLFLLFRLMKVPRGYAEVFLLPRVLKSLLCVVNGV